MRGYVEADPPNNWPAPPSGAVTVAVCGQDVLRRALDVALGRYLVEDAIAGWWARPIPALGGRRPTDLLACGSGDGLLRLIADLPRLFSYETPL